jgi:hypothetical protein
MFKINAKLVVGQEKGLNDKGESRQIKTEEAVHYAQTLEPWPYPTGGWLQ